MHSYLRMGLSLLGGLLLIGQGFAAAPVFSRLDSVGIVLGDSVDYRVYASGDPTSYTAVGLPTGVAINASTGLLSGTPTEVGTYPIKVTATNADGATTGTFNLSVVSPTAGPLIYAPLTFDGFYTPQQGGDTFTCALKATGSPTSFQTSETLPPQWTFSSGGAFVGPSTQPGVHMIPVSATNAYGIGSAAITLRIHPACTQLQQTTGTLHAGDTFTVTVQLNRPVTFSGDAPYLEFTTYPNGSIRRIPYASGNGTTSLQFTYRVTAADSPGDILLFKEIKPATNGGVDGLVDQDGLTLGTTLPIVGTYIPSASIAAAPAPANPVTSNSTAATSTPEATTTTSSSAGTTPTGQVATTPETATGSTASIVSASTAPAPTGATTNSTAVVTPANVAATPATSTSAASGNARLVNLSARASVTDGDADRSFIAGFVVSGTAPKRMLLRAIGPALTGYGVSSVVANPQLRVFDSHGKVVSENDDWSGADVSSTATAVGAFALPNGSHDAAMTVTLQPGSYSFQVMPNGGNGVAMAEIYDADGSAASAPLINISTRAYADSGEKALVAGFVISGSDPKRVLVRGIGPGLAAYGVPNTLSDPAVKLYHEGSVVAQNDDWQTGNDGADVAAAAKSVGAFDLAAGSRDAALIATLTPGAYSAVVSPSTGGPGAGMVEVYELK